MTQATDFYAQMLEAQQRAAEQRVDTRAALLVELRALGVTGIEVQYEGYGELTWALETDKIDVSHSNRYIETNTTEHEGL